MSDPGVLGEAARLASRLEVARERLDVARTAPAVENRRGCGDGPGSGAGAKLDGADDEVRAMLTPAVDRLTRLADLVAALAGGRLSDSAAGDALGELAAAQPVRRSR